MENEIDYAAPARPWLRRVRSLLSSVSIPTLTELAPEKLGMLLLGPAALLHGFIGLVLRPLTVGVAASLG